MVRLSRQSIQEDLRPFDSRIRVCGQKGRVLRAHRTGHGTGRPVPAGRKCPARAPAGATSSHAGRTPAAGNTGGQGPSIRYTGPVSAGPPRPGGPRRTRTGALKGQPGPGRTVADGASPAVRGLRGPSRWRTAPGTRGSRQQLPSAEIRFTPLPGCTGHIAFLGFGKSVV